MSTGATGSSPLTDAESTDSAVASPSVPTPKNLSYTVELYENERWFPLSGWCPKRLPSDRPHFSSKDGKTALDPLQWTLPEGYEWIGDWGVDRDHPKGNDPDGWRYGFSWKGNFQAAMSPSTFVRRRRWIRTMIRIPTNTSTTAVLGNGDVHVREASSANRGVDTVPANVYSVNNESFDVCSTTTPSVPAAFSRRNRQAEMSAEVEEGSPNHEDPNLTTACEEEVQHDLVVQPSASLRYFAERKATSSVIPASRKVKAEEPDALEELDVPISEVPIETTPHAAPTPAPETTTLHVELPNNPAPVAPSSRSRNPFEADEEDEDAAFYGYGISQQPRPQVPSAIECVPRDDNATLSFQRTLTEIVEDVDRHEEQDRQVWEEHQRTHYDSAARFGGAPSVSYESEGSGASPYGAASAVHFETHDDDGQDAFSNMLMHFVSRAKDDA